MRGGFTKSLALHAVVILLVVFGLPHFGEDEIMTAAPIPVEIVSPDQVASAPQRSHKPPPSQTRPRPEPPKPTEPPPPPPEPTPPPPPPEPAPTPDAVQPPPSQQPQQQPPQPQPTPPRPRPRPPRPRPPQPEQAHEQPRQQQRRPNNQFANLLNNLSNTEDDQPPREGVEDSPVEESPNLSSLLNASEMDAVRNQVMGCWLEPTGLKEGQQYVVEIKVVVNRDRTVQSAKVVDSPRMRSDPFYRTLGESAVRALYNPRCSPLMLPEGKYNTWNSITFRFSPGGML